MFAAGPYSVTAHPASQQHLMEPLGRADRSTPRHSRAGRSESQTQPNDRPILLTVVAVSGRSDGGDDVVLGQALGVENGQILNALVAVMNESVEDLACSRAIPDRHLERIARLAYIDPAIVRAILAGTQPCHVSARALWRMASLPLLWADQRKLLRVGAA